MFRKLLLNFSPAVRFHVKVSGSQIQPKFDSFVRCFENLSCAFPCPPHELITIRVVGYGQSNSAVRKRFYKKANVLHNDGKFEVTLDQRKLKTPKGNPFYLESEPLALAIAAEWDAQKIHINPGKMHLFGLASTVLDNPNKITKEDITSNIIKYLDTDTILYTSEIEDELYDVQLKEWIPIIEWFCKRFNVNIEPTRSISGPKIIPEDKEILTKYLLSYNIWALHGFIFAIEALKSVILGVSCIERHILVEKAVSLSRLEEEFQGKRWGRVEWSHELNQQDSQARVAAGVLFVYANSSSNIVRNKAEVLQ